MANVSGRAEPEAEILLLVILGYIVLILLLLFIHRKLLRKQRRIHENLVVLYDTIRYQVARAQYGNPTIQDIKGITVVIQADHKNYVANAKAIKEEIVSIEQKFGQQIISADQRNAINKQAKKKNRFMIFVQLIGRLTTLLTVGIYKLFR
jgi:hypothetical protein